MPDKQCEVERSASWTLVEHTGGAAAGVAGDFRAGVTRNGRDPLLPRARQGSCAFVGPPGSGARRLRGAKEMLS